MKFKAVLSIFVAIFILSVLLGGYKINFLHFNETQNFILWQVRFPRILCVIAVGFGLAICGGTLQTVLKNPLAEPSIIGISTGCALFAGIGILLFSNSTIIIILFAFLGGIISTLLLLAITHKNPNNLMIILTGIAINTICGGGIGLMLFLSSDTTLRDINFWMLGSFANASWFQFIVLLISLLITTVILQKNCKALDVFSLGEVEAKMLGIDVEKFKIQIVCTVCFFVATTVAFFGIIGFVGLITAHIVRIIFGSSMQNVIKFGGMIGGGFLLLSDDIARTIALPSEIPIGIITSTVGGIFFLYLIIQNNARLQ